MKIYFKKGKMEKYLKDEKSLDAFLITNALSGTKITVDKEEMDIKKATLLINKYFQYQKTLDSYDNHFDSELLSKIIKDSTINIETLKDRVKLESEVNKLTDYFAEREKMTLKSYSFELVEDPEQQAYVIKVIVRTSARIKRFKLNSYFMESPELANLVNNFEGIKRYMDSRFHAENEKSTVRDFESLEEFAVNMIQEGKQGAYIQRYKGLGEMNPEQLWETTMNPQNRTLLQIQLEDTIEADEVFSVLMGDQVEPRREFVEKNALNVRNLDI
jgi:DNA gyrase subunit B